MDFFNDLGQGKLFNTFRTELGKVGDAAGYFSIVISSLLQLIVYLIIQIYLNHELTLTLIFSSFLLFFPYKIINRYAKKLGNQSTSAANNFSASIQEMISNSKYFISIGETNTPLNNSIKYLNNHIRLNFISCCKFFYRTTIKTYFYYFTTSYYCFYYKRKYTIFRICSFFWRSTSYCPSNYKILNNFSFVWNYSPSFDQLKKIQKKQLNIKSLMDL